MIHRLRKVTKGLYRGSAPSATDVLRLKNEFGINKIVSLDRLAGNRINRPCKILGIKHIILPIDIDNLNESLINFLKHDIKDLLLSDGPTYVHCAEGKDRTGLAVALLQCKYFGKNPEDAIEEAKSLGFGLRVDPKVIHTFEKRDVEKFIKTPQQWQPWQWQPWQWQPLTQPQQLPTDASSLTEAVAKWWLTTWM